MQKWKIKINEKHKVAGKIVHNRLNIGYKILFH